MLLNDEAANEPSLYYFSLIPSLCGLYLTQGQYLRLIYAKFAFCILLALPTVFSLEVTGPFGLLQFILFFLLTLLLHYYYMSGVGIRNCTYYEVLNNITFNSAFEYCCYPWS